MRVSSSFPFFPSTVLHCFVLPSCHAVDDCFMFYCLCVSHSLEEGGQTALGPALLVSIAIASRVHGSKVLLVQRATHIMLAYVYTCAGVQTVHVQCTCTGIDFIFTVRRSSFAQMVLLTKELGVLTVNTQIHVHNVMISTQ